MHKKTKTYVEAACKAAENSRMRSMHGAVIVFRGEVIATACNEPMDFKTKWSVHAELAAIKMVNKRILKECEMYVVRIGKPSSSIDSYLRYSKPCTHCRDAIINAQIRAVYYSYDDSYNGPRNCSFDTNNEEWFCETRLRSL
jgi:tRNA(Arg) A34 adenosine deaminase TadA